ncbi:DnaB-like helicase N-terminal domain-containing protein [Micromonospora coerulea]|uniref:DnaB-like helicase N-terminal domain-containing protein n=1 Tax=Micromonospora coerulea TaxID=47856 RepID=UPI003D15C473
MNDVDQLAHGAEQIVLGAAMLDPAAVEKVTPRLTGSAFHNPRHACVYCDPRTRPAPTGPGGRGGRLVGGAADRPARPPGRGAPAGLGRPRAAQW